MAEPLAQRHQLLAAVCAHVVAARPSVWWSSSAVRCTAAACCRGGTI